MNLPTDRKGDARVENRESWRASVVIPKEIETAIFRLRQRDEFSRDTISDMLRMLLEKGLEHYGYPEQSGSDTRTA